MNTVLKSAMQRQQLHNVVLLHRLINVRHGHTVRIIAIKDMGPKFYTNDVVTVKAGYARNYLIPQKIAVYATRENFKKRNLVDPQLETAEEKKLRLLRESENVEDQNKKEADRLRKYLLNKSIILRRSVDVTSEAEMGLAPSFVKAVHLRKKISNQLKIDLEVHERIHLYGSEISPDATEADLEGFIATLEPDPMSKCPVIIKQLGYYVARISLRGGYYIPLRFQVVKR